MSHPPGYWKTYYGRKEIKTKLYKIRQQILSQLDRLKDKPCTDCGGWFNPWQMDWDHKDPKKKTQDISNLRFGNRMKYLEELKKCELVCANCHRQRTYERSQYGHDASASRIVNSHKL
jgi:gamma-glutamylcyclotransferase (GGCT)/AIG2-like uncharacterized protein YtfP